MAPYGSGKTTTLAEIVGVADTLGIEPAEIALVASTWPTAYRLRGSPDAMAGR